MMLHVFISHWFSVDHRRRRNTIYEQLPCCSHWKHSTEEDADPGVLDSATSRNRLRDSEVSNHGILPCSLSTTLRCDCRKKKKKVRYWGSESCIIPLPSLVWILNSTIDYHWLHKDSFAGIYVHQIGWFSWPPCPTRDYYIRAG